MARKVIQQNRKQRKLSGQKEQDGRSRSFYRNRTVSEHAGPEAKRFFSQWCTPKGFLEFVANKLEWEELPNAVFMDVGCGNAEIQLAQYILDRFPETSEVFAIDKDVDVLFRHLSYKAIPKIKFRAADIEDPVSMQKYVGSIDKLLSLNCFHMLYKPITALANIFNLLKPGGEAAIVFCHRSGYVGWHEDMSEKWGQYLILEMCPNVPVTQDERLNISFYSNWLQRIGFEVVLLKNDTISTLYKSEEDLKRKLFKLGHETFSIPDHKRQEFEVDLLNAFLENNPRTPCGVFRQVSSYVTMLVRKRIDQPKFNYFSSLR